MCFFCIFIADVYPMTSPVQPKCDGQGNFHTKQCHNGMCWCVAPDGTVAEGSLTKGKLDCDKNGQYKYTLWWGSVIQSSAETSH